MGRLVKQPHGGYLIPWEKGQSGNPAGRPRKYVSKLQGEGYAISEINQCLQFMMAMTVDELNEVHKNPKSTVLEKTVAAALYKGLQKGSLFNLETVLSRAFGTPKQTTELQGETAIVHKVKLG